MNQADKAFVEGLKSALTFKEAKDFSHVYIKQCIAIIEKQGQQLEQERLDRTCGYCDFDRKAEERIAKLSRALEKAKEQRDFWNEESSCHLYTNEAKRKTELKKSIAADNQELEQILGDG